MRPYMNVEEYIAQFVESGETIMEVDTLNWMADKTACDSIRRCIKRNGYKDLVVFRRNDRVFVLKL
jgi:hypothetical protein